MVGVESPGTNPAFWGTPCTNPQLWTAAQRGEDEEISDLLWIGADVEEKGANMFGFCTPLQVAVQSGKYDPVHILLQHGATVHVTDSTGMSPLHDTCSVHVGYEGFGHIARLLIKYGANIDAVDQRGWTALHFAANAGLAYIVNVLVQHNADSMIKTMDGRTAKQLSSRPAVQRMLECEETKLKEKCLAFSMGQHKRLGSKASMYGLHTEMVHLVVTMCGI